MPQRRLLDFVCATRLSEEEFWQHSALGLSLRRIEFDERWAPRVAFTNSRGLPEIYNARIDAENAAEILVFLHDDIWLDDYHFMERIVEALHRFDIVGLAGNRRRLPLQASWLALNRSTPPDAEYVSGSVAHGRNPFGSVSFFGPAPAECELLDGLLLAARTDTLRQRLVRFDPDFEFHFYDLDFCRSARAKGLKLGTWPISVTHQSGGTFSSSSWQQKYNQYIDKWLD